MKKDAIYVLTCYVLWGILPVFWKLLADLNSQYVLASRIVWSLAFTAVILTLEHRWGAVRAVFHDRGELLHLAASGTLICVNWGLFIWAVNGGRILDSSLAYYMNPILTILLGTLVFRERLSKLQWLSVLVTFTGLVFTVIRYGQFPWLSVVIGGSFALYGAVKKNVRADSTTSMLVETLLLSPFALTFILWAEAHGTGAVGILSGTRWLLLPLAGVITTVPLLFFAKGIKHTPLTLSGILMYINPTIQLLVSVLLYHEAFTTTYAILFGFVWFGLALFLLASLRGNPGQKENET